MISSSFWRERNVFLTGHTSFEGCWLALMLERLNARVTGYGPEPTAALFDLLGAGAHLCDVRGDLGDGAFLDGALRAADPDIVIHLAPPIQPGYSLAREAADWETLLDVASRAPSVRAAIALRRARLDRTAANNFPSSGDMRVLAVECGALTGGGVATPEVVSTEQYQHALDALYGVLSLAERACCPDADLEGVWRWGQDDAPCSDLFQETTLDWRPLLTSQETMTWTQDWRRAFIAGQNMRAQTLAQIDVYLGQRVRLTSPFTHLQSHGMEDLVASGTGFEPRRALG